MVRRTRFISLSRQECIIMFRSIVLLVGGLASLGTASLFAQDAVLGQEYGAGVHAFFAGDYAGAYEHLAVAIQGGSKDPRAFYFRGLACLNLGRGPDATIDFRKGAELESADVNRFYNVGKALERVQGSGRAELEKYRVAARMAALEAAEKLRKERYEALQREESRVLREQAESAPPSGEEIVQPPPTSDDEDDDVFGGLGKATKPAKKPAKAGKKSAKAAPADDADEDPFATGPKEEKKPKADKPADKAKKPDAEKKPSGEDDPFAEPKAPKKPADKKPDAAKKPDAEKKPDAKKPDAKKPDAGKKADGKKADPNDPFAE
jgi:hypothetical protein